MSVCRVSNVSIRSKSSSVVYQPVASPPTSLNLSWGNDKCKNFREEMINARTESAFQCFHSRILISRWNTTRSCGPEFTLHRGSCADRYSPRLLEAAGDQITLLPTTLLSGTLILFLAECVQLACVMIPGNKNVILCSNSSGLSTISAQCRVSRVVCKCSISWRMLPSIGYTQMQDNYGRNCKISIQ